MYVITILLLFTLPSDVTADKTWIRIGALLPVNRTWPFAESFIIPAAQFAKKHVRRNHILNDSFEIEISNKDTDCNDRFGMNQAITYFTEHNVSAFFGPTCDFVAAPVARQVTFWNKTDGEHRGMGT